MTLDLVEALVVVPAVVAGALVQGSIGFGFSLVVTPVMGLASPTALPATILFLALPMTIWMSLRERGAMDARGFVEITLGRLPGTAAAAWLLASISTAQVTVVIGAAVLAAAGLSALAPEFELGTRARLLAGMVSGFMGTVAAIGGPPLALAYQNRPGAELRSTLAASFVIGSILSLIALAVAGEVEAGHALVALQLVLPLALGLFLAASLRRLLDRTWLRPAILVFAAISGAAALVKGLL